MFIIKPWLPDCGLAMVHAERGLGKTYFCLALSLHIALGRIFLNWPINKPLRVLYVDGEMLRLLMQQRLKQLMPEGTTLPQDDQLRFLCACRQSREVNFSNFSTAEGQSMLTPFLEGVDVLVLDSVATLMSGIDENDVKSWSPIQNWLLSLRKMGIAVIFAHHDNKDKTQRGTSAKEDILDSVIHLQTLSSKENAIKMLFTKSRGFLPAQEDIPNLHLVDLPNGRIEWRQFESETERKKTHHPIEKREPKPEFKGTRKKDGLGKNDYQSIAAKCPIVPPPIRGDKWDTFFA